MPKKPIISEIELCHYIVNYIAIFNISTIL